MSDWIIEKTLELKAPPDRVWRALTDPDELGSWFPDRADWEPGEGNQGHFIWEKHGSYAVQIELFEPTSRLAWRWAGDSDKPLDQTTTTLVEWELLPRDDGGTTLKLRETGFLEEKSYQMNVDGWEHELGELVEYLEG